MILRVRGRISAQTGLRNSLAVEEDCLGEDEWKDPSGGEVSVKRSTSES